MKPLLVVVLILSFSIVQAQTIHTHFLKRLMQKNHSLFDTVLQSAGHKQVQILYTKIDRDRHNIPRFTMYDYHMNPAWYFYPASTVKLPAVIFSSEKINGLNRPGLTKESRMFTDSAYTGQTKVVTDSTAQNGMPSIAHYIKKILLTSDNDAFNRLYEFTGKAEINRKLKANGINDSRIINRLAIGDKGESAKHTNPIRFYSGDTLVYQQPAQYDTNDYPLQLQNLIRGKGYINEHDSLVMQPYSFENRNVYTITSQQRILRKLLFPEAFTRTQRFNLTNDDYQFIYKYMSMYPTESDYPAYNRQEFYPAYSKMLFYGRDTNAVINPDVRIFNKYGDSYGYIIDNAYIVDFKNKVEFLLTAVVQSNNDEIYNDNKYEYERVCYPFMKNIGQVIYKYELQRKRRYQPNVTKFKFDYTNGSRE